MDDSDRSLGDRFADVLDSVGLENLTDDYREHKNEADEALERAFAGDTEDCDDGDDGVPPVNWQRFDADSPAGSGSYAGPAPIYDAASRASNSAVSRCLDDYNSAVYGGATGTF